MSYRLDELNRRFALPDALHLTEAVPGLPVLEVSTPHVKARLALQGAQLLAWQPAGAQPVIWVSKAALYEPGKGVRGGVPVCWPWFGAKEGLPAHGFVRTRLWELRQTRRTAGGDVVLVLGLSDDASTRAVWPHAFDLELQVTLGRTLDMALTTRNTGGQPIQITQALHTYFCVGDIRQTRVLGLQDTRYLDKVQGFEAFTQQGEVTFTGETDRVYVDTTHTCVIDDAAGSRQIHVAKEGSTSTVVWNPWQEREKAFADMATGEYVSMLCVETCNAGPDVVTVNPGTSHTLRAVVSL